MLVGFYVGRYTQRQPMQFRSLRSLVRWFRMVMCMSGYEWVFVCVCFFHNLLAQTKMHYYRKTWDALAIVAASSIKHKQKYHLLTEWWRMWPKSSLRAHDTRFTDEQMSFITGKRYQSTDRIFSMARWYAGSVNPTIYWYKRLSTLNC